MVGRRFLGLLYPEVKSALGNCLPSIQSSPQRSTVASPGHLSMYPEYVNYWSKLSIVCLTWLSCDQLLQAQTRDFGPFINWLPATVVSPTSFVCFLFTENTKHDTLLWTPTWQVWLEIAYVFKWISPHIWYLAPFNQIRSWRHEDEHFLIFHSPLEHLLCFFLLQLLNLSIQLRQMFTTSNATHQPQRPLGNFLP